METLDIVIGIVIYFLFMSLVASAIVEMISALTRKRGKILRHAVDATTNGGDDFNNALYLHPLVYGLYESEKVGASEGKSLPSYMPANVFAQAYVETVIDDSLTDVGDLGTMFASKTRQWPDSREISDHEPTEQRMINPKKFATAFRKSIPHRIPGSLDPVATLSCEICIKFTDLNAAYQALRPHVLAASGDPTKTLERVATHFNRVNNRIKGRYRRWVSSWLFIIGLTLAMGTNGDATRILDRLVNDPTLRNAVVENAATLVNKAQDQSQNQPKDKNNIESGEEKDFRAIREETLQNIRFLEGISGGWKSDPIYAPNGLTLSAVLFKLLGLLITAFAISLGAPFWFDLLNKLLKIKELVKTKAQADSEDTASSGAPKVESIDEVSTVITAINAKMEPSSLLLSKTQREHIQSMAQYAMASYDPKLEFEKTVAELSLEEDAEIDLVSKKRVVEIEGLDENEDSITTKIPVDTQAYVVRGKKRVVVAFRGTEKNFHDFATDARFKPIDVKWTQKGKDEPIILVHRGFATALELVWKEIEGLLTKTEVKDLPVYFTGHSLGGALAVLAAARFASPKGLNQQNRLAGLNTFGQPRVGNPAFADWTKSLFGNCYIRSVNHRDIVPQVPPPKVPIGETVAKFQHSGIVHVFDSSGRLAINPGWFFRLADYGLPDDELKEMLQQTIQNHDIHLYVGLYGS